MADRFFSQGALERSSYLLQLARNQYDALDDKEKVERCTALIHEIDGSFSEAAAAYERLGELADAIRCYWEAKSYNKISEMMARDPGRFSNSPFVLAARFMNGTRRPEDIEEFLRLLSEAGPERLIKYFECSHWEDVLQQAVSALVDNTEVAGEIDRNIYKEVLRILMRLEKDKLVTLIRSRELSLLAYNADDHVVALEVWNDASGHDKAREPKFILRARALTTPYPHSLQWYGMLNDCDAIVREYKNNLDHDLDEDQYTIVLDSLVDKNEFELAVTLVKKLGSWHEMRHLLKSLPDSKLGVYAAKLLLGSYLKACVDRREFRKVIEDIRKEKTEITVLSTLFSDETMQIAAEAGLIKLLARDQGLVEQGADEKFISGRILSIVKKHSRELRQLLTSEEVGAALERAGRMDNALAFYELIYKSKLWGADQNVEHNAKQRWLKCKERQAALGHVDPKRRDQRFAEAKRRSADWGLPIPSEEYPPLEKLEFNEIDALFAETGRAAKVIGRGEEGLANGIKKSESIESDSDRKQDDEEEQDNLSQSTSFVLPARQAFKGRVVLTCQHDSVDIEVMLLPGKRRLEVRDKANSDLLMIYVNDASVESRDIKVTSTGSNAWHIESWLMNIQIIQLSCDTAFVDVTDSDDFRLFCLVV
ncbi:hypothetical protein Rifp1Sym_dg00010 [endosymbiont of Riftia pachyptila (vent Ph05)]|uniref:Uncharacterized protein n=1 Tax=endosymbiont of Riftia pachyptila (vent Ph05) TaxID=1048808 RepID=G2DG65_9GAMM|nr:hypothetical protein Rifp1Sym_dg00010 [endosymbiont of Riftia pachyptila (vent Ph05)]